MANTTTSNTTGLLGLAGQAGITSPTYYGQYPQQYGSNMGLSQQMFNYPAATPSVVEKEITVPILEVSDYKGIFLRDKEGKLIHVSAQRLYQALGYEW